MDNEESAGMPKTGEGGEGNSLSPREDNDGNAPSAAVPTPSRGKDEDENVASGSGSSDAPASEKKSARKTKHILSGGNNLAVGVKMPSRPAKLDSSMIQGGGGSRDDGGVEEPSDGDEGGGCDMANLKSMISRPGAAVVPGAMAVSSPPGDSTDRGAAARPAAADGGKSPSAAFPSSDDNGVSTSASSTASTSPGAVAVAGANPPDDWVGKKQNIGLSLRQSGRPLKMSGISRSSNHGNGVSTSVSAGANMPDWVGRKQNLGRSVRQSVSRSVRQSVSRSVRRSPVARTSDGVGSGKADRATVQDVSALAANAGIGVVYDTAEAGTPVASVAQDGLPQSLSGTNADADAKAKKMAKALGIGAAVTEGGDEEPETTNGPRSTSDPLPGGELRGTLRGSLPGAYAMEGADDSDDGIEPPDDGREARHLADIENGPSLTLPHPPLTHSSTSPDPEFEVVATLVEPTQDVEDGSYYPPEEEVIAEGAGSGNAQRAPSIVAVAVAQQLKCGINFSDRRVRFAACFVLAAFAALAVGLGIALGKGESSSGAAAAGARAPPPEGDSFDSSDDEAAPPPIPSTPEPSAGPSAPPTVSWFPSASPTIAPTVQSWERVGSTLDGKGNGGKLGSKVFISSDGSTVIASYESGQEFHSFRAISYSTTAAIIIEENTTAKGDDIWNVASSVLPDCIFWSKATMGLAGNGKMAVLVSAGCGSMGVSIWEKLVLPTVELEPSPSMEIVENGEGQEVPPPVLNIDTDEGQEIPQPQSEWVPQGTSSEGLASDYHERRVQSPEVALSEDGSVVAIGHDGAVTVRERFSQRGPLGMRHPSAVIPSGKALSLSADGAAVAVAIASPFVTEEVDGTENVVEWAYDSVEVRRKDGSTGEWVRVGSESIIGRSATVKSTSLSADGTVLAVGASQWDYSPPFLPCSKCGPDNGRASVYRLDDGGNWTLMGQVLFGDERQDDFGRSVSLSRDGMHLAVGAPGSDVPSVGAGMVRVFRFDAETDEWVLSGGESILGSEGLEAFGTAVSLSGDGRRVAIGAPTSRVGGNDSGRVSVFELHIS